VQQNLEGNKQSRSRRVSEHFFAGLSLCKESPKVPHVSGKRTPRRRRDKKMFLRKQKLRKQRTQKTLAK
jgi:hypothetical protein